MKSIFLVPVEHRNEKRLLVKFPYDSELIGIIKKVEGATFSATHKSWHVANNPVTLKELFRIFKGFAFVDASAVSERSSKLEKEKVGSNSRQEAVNGDQLAVTSKLATEDLQLTTEKKGEALFDPLRKGRVVLMEIVDEKKIILRFPFAKAHVAKIKTLPYYTWHKEEKHWSFP
jgi:hypothetical protein